MKVLNEAPRAEARGFLERNTERPSPIRTLNGAVLWPRMYKILILFFILGLPFAQAYPQQEKFSFDSRTYPPVDGPLNLYDCYRLALKRSEEIAINGQFIREAEAHFLQALTYILPSISWSSMDGRQDNTNLSNIYPKATYQRNFVYTQTIFSGFKAFAGITGSKLERKQRVKEKIRAEQLLFRNVSDAFYLYLEQKEDLKTLQIIKDALLKRVDELKAREALGRSRHSETVNTLVQLYRIESEFYLVKSRQKVAKNLLEFLTGRQIGEIRDMQKGFPYLKPEKDYLLKVDTRPDVMANEFAWEVAKKGQIIARSGFLPEVTLNGNYYTARNTPPTDSNWDANIAVNVPIFDGGQTLGDVKQANAKALEAELAYSRLKRQTINEISDAYTVLKESISRTKALTKALTAAVVNYNLQKEDYRLSLVSNLDVLESIRTMGEARRDYVHSLYETKQFYWQLKVATGELPNF